MTTLLRVCAARLKRAKDSRQLRFLGIVTAGLLLLANKAPWKEVQVMTSGAFTEACIELSPEFERKTSTKVVTAFGASMGNTPEAIPSRMERGEPVEIMPVDVRTAGFSLAYSLATALFGGFTPAISTYLIHITGYPSQQPAA